MCARDERRPRERSRTARASLEIIGFMRVREKRNVFARAHRPQIACDACVGRTNAPPARISFQSGESDARIHFTLEHSAERLFNLYAHAFRAFGEHSDEHTGSFTCF